MAISDYSTTPASNTSISGINVAENCPPANVNNAIRQLMADLAVQNAALPDGSDFQPIDPTLTALAALTTAANKLPYATGSDSFTTTDFTAYGRTLLALADAAALRTNIGAVTVTAASLAANGYVKLNISGTDFIIQWGTFTAAANSSTTVSLPTAFASFSRTVCNGVGETGTGQQATQPTVRTSSLTSFSAFSGADVATTAYFISVGV